MQTPRYSGGGIILGATVFNFYRQGRSYTENSLGRERTGSEDEAFQGFIAAGLVFSLVTAGGTGYACYRESEEAEAQAQAAVIQQLVDTHGSQLAQSADHGDKIRTREVFVLEIKEEVMSFEPDYYVIHYVDSSGSKGVTKVKQRDLDAVRALRPIKEALNEFAGGTREYVIASLREKLVDATIDEDIYMPTGVTPIVLVEN